MINVNVNNLGIQLDEETNVVTIAKNNATWKFREGFKANLECEEGILYFEDALSVSHKVITSGVGEGIQSHYEGFETEGKKVPYAFDTIMWIEAVSGDIYCEWIPLCEEGLHVKRVWPAGSDGI